MPELYSRMDESNWLTPSISDILEQGAAPPGGDGSIRDHMLTIQRELADLETPAKIINVRSMPSYTLYVARPETIGRLGNRRTITVSEIRRSLARVAETHSDWLLGFIPKLQEDETTLGILLRTSAHRPLSLRRLLVRGNFRSAPTYHSFTLGITLEQNLIVRDLNAIGHLLVVGGDNAKLHFLRSMLLTLILLNTPTELRLILGGKGAESVKALVATPHCLGRLVTQPEGVEKILDGLTKEIQRRTATLSEHNVSTIDAYNALARETGKAPLPRILVFLDGFVDDANPTTRQSILNYLVGLLKNGATLGIHIIATVGDNNQLPQIEALIETHIVMRTVAKSLIDQLTDFHPSLLRFIDAFVVEKSLNNAQITPVELCSTTNTELINAIAYWQQNRQNRQVESSTADGKQKSGITDLLGSPELTPLVVAPPDPYRNPLTRNTAILLDRDAIIEQKISNLTAVSTSTLEAEVVRVPEVETQEASPPHSIETQLHETVAIASPNGDEPKDANLALQQAIALAAYLGWLSIGALMDIFFYTHEEAEKTLQTLKENKILEDTHHPTPRFLLPSQKL